MAVTTREELKEYALRALGAPVLQINVADEQLEDRIDEAIAHFQLYRYDGIERIYLKHTISRTKGIFTAFTRIIFMITCQMSRTAFIATV